MELFTFMAMSADSHRICVVPLAAGESEGARREARQQLLASFDRFDAAHARCFLPQDRAALLSVIESTLQLDEFNRWVRSVFRERSRRTSGASAVPITKVRILSLCTSNHPSHLYYNIQDLHKEE